VIHLLIDKLLEHFNPTNSLHIDVNDVRDRLIAMGVQDEIYFRFVKMDHNKIRAILYRYIRHAATYGEPIFCSDIVLAEDQGDEGEEWMRLAAVKELLHITDCDKITAKSDEAVDNLFSKLSLPPDMRISKSGNKSSIVNDLMRTYFALAILVPKACRDALRPLYKIKLSDQELALMAKIPVRYISVVMSPDFDGHIDAFLQWESGEQKA
jgi:hypothetical protein